MGKRSEKPKKASMGGIGITSLCCLLGVYTSAKLFGGVAAEDPMIFVTAGVMLALGYLLLRPILKLLTLPIGCLTLGLTNFAIDVGLLYLCAYLIEGFQVTSILGAIGTAFLINGVSAVAGGFK